MRRKPQMPDAPQLLLFQKVINAAALQILRRAVVIDGVNQVKVDVIRSQALQLLRKYGAEIGVGRIQKLGGEPKALPWVPLHHFPHGRFGLPAVVHIGGIQVVHAVAVSVVNHLGSFHPVYRPIRALQRQTHIAHSQQRQLIILVRFGNHDPHPRRGQTG